MRRAFPIIPSSNKPHNQHCGCGAYSFLLICSSLKSARDRVSPLLSIHAFPFNVGGNHYSASGAYPQASTPFP